ncbi:MAG TPA: hypothetical protein VH497_17205 [Vicinamibacterales bacterium]|jgi:hypothetical protein
MLASLHFCMAQGAFAHDAERTRAWLTFSRDGTFVLDVANDPAWLKLRLESFPGPFADRVVLFVDGHEVRPTSTEFIPADAPGNESTPETPGERPLAMHRMRGQMPLDARTLRWYYGLVGDPYPLVVKLADGQVRVEEIQGDAWSGAIDLSGQFARPARWPIVLVAGLLAAGVTLRIGSRLRSEGARRL